MNEIRNSLKVWAKSNNISNASISIINKDNIESVNLHNKDNQVTESSHNLLFEMGSCTKLITAICILKLSKKNKLNLTDNITEYLIELESYFPKNITIKQLLSHSSGYHSDGFLTHVLDSQTQRADVQNKSIKFNNYIRETYSESDFLKDKPNNYYYYNSGYVLLGKIIENVTGTTYEDYVINNIIRPLDITNAEFRPLSEYNYNISMFSQKNANLENLDINSAAGLITSTEEYAKIIKSLINNELRIDSKMKKEMLSKQIIKSELVNNKKQYYGFGIMCQEYANDTLFYHTGYMIGSTWFGFLKEEKKGLIISCDSRPDKSVSEVGKSMLIELSNNIDKSEIERNQLQNFIENAQGTYSTVNNVRKAIVNKSHNNCLEIRFGWENNLNSYTIQPTDVKNNIGSYVTDAGEIKRVEFNDNFNTMKFKRWLLNKNTDSNP